MRAENVLQIIERQAGVENVFYEDDVAAFDRLIEVFGEAHFPARARAVTVAGDADKIETGIEIHAPGQVAEKNAGPFQHADEDDRLAGKIPRDLCAELGDALGDLLATEQNRQL